MPLFRYRALTTDGRTIKGVIDADSLFVAKERLRRQQLLVTDVAPQGAFQKNIDLPSKFLLTFTQELAQLLRAGLPLYESLLTIEEKYGRHKAHAILLDSMRSFKRRTCSFRRFKKIP